MGNKKPIILGVLNVSPESKQKDSVAIGKKAILKRAKFLKKFRASYIDVGARSAISRLHKINEKVELERLIPSINILKEKNYRISIDTWSANTAIKCLENGVDMINFTSGVYGIKLLKALRKYRAWLIMTYMPYRDPYNIDISSPLTPNFKKIISYFQSKLKLAKKYGVKAIIDPNLGIGHPKVERYIKIYHDMRVINNLWKFKKLGKPVIVSVPRFKDTSRVVIYASSIIQNNPDYIRTHDPDIIRKLLSIKNG